MNHMVARTMAGLACTLTTHLPQLLPTPSMAFKYNFAFGLSSLMRLHVVGFKKSSLASDMCLSMIESDALTLAYVRPREIKSDSSRVKGGVEVIFLIKFSRSSCGAE